MGTLPRMRWSVLTRVFLGLTISFIACLFFWWLWARSESISALPSIKGAQWILYPEPIDADVRAAAPISALFYRSFVLFQPSVKASLQICSFKSGTATLNGRPLLSLKDPTSNWKAPASLDVSGLLLAGTNILSVSVTNAQGPPALWLRFKAGPVTICTDEAWQVSLAGATLARASLARRSFSVPAASPLGGSERVADSLRRIWPVLAMMFAVSLLLVLSIDAWSARRKRAWVGSTPDRWSWCLLATVLAARLTLSIHNLNLLPQITGFDAGSHEDYVQYILEKEALPLPQEGWEMHQPPLYYAASALLLGLFDLSPKDPPGCLVLHAVNGVFGLVQCYLLFLCLRLLFPQSLAAQAVGLLAGAFLPPVLYLSAFVTNDVLAALFITVAFYLCLLALRKEKSVLRPVAI